MTVAVETLRASGFPDLAEYESKRRAAAPPPTDRGLDRRVAKELLAELAERAPGNSVELRVPPFGVTQIVAGPRHRRGEPSATIELDLQTLVDLCLGELSWARAVSSGRVLASGQRADLSDLVPLVGVDSGGSAAAAR